MDRPLKIARCVEAYAPAPGGMAEVVRQLSERMAAMGHQVTVFTATHPARGSAEMNGVTVRGFDLRGNLVDGITGDPAPYRTALRDGHFDVITLFAAQQWATDAVLRHLSGLPGKKVFVPTGFSGLHQPRWAEYYRQMPDWLRAMDLNVFLSHTYQDITFARSHGVQHLTVIPNGAATEEFDQPPTYDFRTAHGLKPRQHVVLHIGGYSGLKGHREAIRIFVRARTGDAVLVLIGNGVKALEGYWHRHYRYLPQRLLGRWRGKRILFQESQRPETVDAMKQADLFLFPSNVECSPIVLFEAMAAGVPFLASGAGNAAEIAAWSKSGWTIPGKRDRQGLEHPDIAAGARMLEDLLHDPNKRKVAGEAGRKAWRERFTWQHIAEQYTAAYLRLAGTKG
jgi:glycosyltransferase involved in cell wall biosynthesis